ncbi:MAG: zinc-dependent alcohol dehydrogenase family protein [Pseudomonadota bacterium]
MRAAVLRAFGGPIPVKTVPDPACPRDGVIVEVRACGVCRSDHHAWKGLDPDVALPHVMGHEMAGVVAEAGPESGFEPGARVTAPFILGCGTCGDCAAGQPTICATQHVLGFSGWGAFAEYVAIPHAAFNLVRLPDVIDFAQAAGMGCRVTTAYRALTERAGLRAGEWLCVHGCGGIGLSAIMIARALGAPVIAVDVNAEALALAADFGAEHCLDASTLSPADLIDAIHEASGGGAHVAIDALGITTTFHNALRSLRKGGRYVQIGMPVGPHAEPTIPLLDLVYARQLSLHGTRGMAARGFPGLFEIARDGRLDLDALIARRIALEEVGTVLAAMDRFQGAGVTVIDRF